MSMHSGYGLEVVRNSADLVLCRGRRAGGPSVLALLDDQQPPSPRHVERFQHEYALAVELDSAWAARPLELTWDEGRPLLVLEDFGGEPLDLVLRRANGHVLELSRFLRIASNLAWALARVHKQGLVHKDIKPANVLVNDADDVRLFGFGIASRLVGERQTIARSELIAGTLAYMAPEQTGRMNRSVDARTDLYSLGITLYEMIAGELPFSAVDPMDWIHCHIARQPPPPRSRTDNIPGVIDAIILKLLAKDPEDRYQTAAGLETDLRHCLSEWERFGVVEPFLLASRDVPDQLLIPEMLYGRDQQIEALRAAFERVACRGAPELVLVRGYAGIGKSSVVNELHKVLMPARCWFATGKFDQYKRDIPYATLGQALQGLVHQLLGKNDAELARWREAIQQALGPNGQLMVNLIPDLALLVGEQPPIPPVDSQDAVNRFYSVFRSLLEVFARPQHPLVLFIDDLQWLDEATLELLRRLITDPGSCQALVIGAYRDTEVGPQHPLMERLGAITEAGATVSHITLAPLQTEHVGQLLADALHTDVDSTASLAELVYEKTGGNPFFAIQFIKELAEEKLLTFDSDTRTWEWTVESIRSKGITDNVAELMATKLSRLSADARCAMGQLACLGNVGDVAVLSSLRGVPAESLQETLSEAVEAGLLVSNRKSFAFVHDRVHEAAYALIPEGERAQVHLRIARTLLHLTAPRELEDKVFEIVNHFDRGVTAMDLDNERESVAELHLIAGRRAKASSANASALSYFAAGSALLGSDRWERLYQLSFELELNQADCEIVVGELLAAESRLTALAACVLGLSDRSAVICLTVLLYFTTGKNDQAVEVALEFLARAGILWTARPNEAEVRAEYEEMHRKLARQPMETLIDLPAMTDAGCMAIMAVLTELFPAAYAVDRYLMELVLLRMTNLSLEYGNGESSSVAYGALNMALGEHFADYATSYGLGQVACQLVEHRGNDRYKARVYSCFGAFTLPWVKHLPLCKPMMCEAFSIGCAIGDTAFAAYNARNLITHMLVSGIPLAEVQSYAESAIEFAQAVQLGLPYERFFGQLDLIQKLRGVSEPDDLSEETWVTPDVAQQPGLAMMVCYYWIFRLQERYFAEDFSEALAAASHLDGIRWAMRSSIEEAEYDFYAALSLATACDEAVGAVGQQQLSALKHHYDQIAARATNCAENFSNREALIGAEIARIEGRDNAAQHLYEDAVRLARNFGFVQNEGLANELAGRFYMARGLETAADGYLRNARDCYERWGATSKVKRLEARYPRLRARPSSSALATTIDRSVAHLDVETVDKASQTLSSEMALPSLLEKLMRLAVEHAGAERGLLILLHGDAPIIEAEATTANGGVEVTLPRTLATSLDLPPSALQYALRSHGRLVLDDGSAQGLDPDDEYVHKNRPRSVLCLPIFKQEKVIGVLYLENNLVVRAFTSGRVAVLDFLASQAAIWLDNARLYSHLRRSETWLKEAQHLSSTGSFFWRVDLDFIEFSEQLYRIHGMDPNLPTMLDLIATRIHPDDLPIMQEMIDIGRGPASDLDYFYRLRMPDLSVKHVHLVAHSTRSKDGHVEYIGSIQDVTQHHMAEKMLERTRSELSQVARVAGLGVLTASIAHEVNQPLAGIVTNASTCLRMLSAEPANIEGARETARRMIRDGHRASDVIARLRVLFGKKDAPTESVDLNEAAREVVVLLGIDLQGNQVIVRTEFASSLPLVRGDRIQLQQVIQNLLRNGSEAMDAVHDRQRRLLLRTELAAGNQICLTVQDTGIGLGGQEAECLFQAFYTTKQDGMGIGLSVSRSIIENHGGRLWATQNDGPGATFSFSIPSDSSATPAPLLPRAIRMPYATNATTIL